MISVTGSLCLLLSCAVQPDITAIILKNTFFDNGGFFVPIFGLFNIRLYNKKDYFESEVRRMDADGSSGAAPGKRSSRSDLDGDVHLSAPGS
ncbi:hypothetical protein [Lacrimispora sp.]|uniref:hypothetical protein n=1 Tax=Lacrimispora sp. TaxID=2719234 RepID=UPI0032E40B3E